MAHKVLKPGDTALIKVFLTIRIPQAAGGQPAGRSPELYLLAKDFTIV
jgi:hypothetical protein